VGYKGWAGRLVECVDAGARDIRVETDIPPSIDSVRQPGRREGIHPPPDVAARSREFSRLEPGVTEPVTEGHHAFRRPHVGLRRREGTSCDPEGNPRCGRDENPRTIGGLSGRLWPNSSLPDTNARHQRPTPTPDTNARRRSRYGRELVGVPTWEINHATHGRRAAPPARGRPGSRTPRSCRS